MSAGVAVGYLVDRVAGEPPGAAHPVAWFGRYASWLQRRMYAPSRRRGAAYVVVALAPVAVAAVLLRWLFGRFAAAAIVGSIAIAARMLSDEARAVADLLDRGETDVARVRARALVGRDLADAPPGEIARAAVESLAENSVDAVVASLWWGVVAGAPGIALHRGANTLDAMVGHRSKRYERFGWAAARLDDAANFVPARLTAAAVAVVVPKRASVVGRAVARDAPAHPSPNAGVVEAAFAASLGIRLGGLNRYGDAVERRPGLGDGPPPSVDDIGRADDLARRVHTTVVVAVLTGRLIRYGLTARSEARCAR